MCYCFFFSSRRRHTRCALVTGVQTCALPICVSLMGTDISRHAPHRRVRAGLAQVLEGRQVFGPLSVADNLLLGGYVRGRAASERRSEGSRVGKKVVHTGRFWLSPYH